MSRLHRQSADGGATSDALKVLLVEDSEQDAALVLQELKRAGLRCESRRVQTESDLRRSLLEFQPHVVVSDFTMPGFNGMQALGICRESNADVPFIFVSGTVGEDIAVEAMKAGAGDYVMKTSLVRLGAAVQREVREAEVRRQRRTAEVALHRAQIMAKLAHVITAPDGSFESWSDTLPQLIGSEPPPSTRAWLELLHADDRPAFRAKAIEAGAGRERAELEYRLRRPDGEWIHLRQTMEPLSGEADARGRARWFNTLQDVTEQKKAEERIVRLNRVYAMLSGINSLIVRVADREELFREACRIAVELGQFRLAWIGVVERAEARIRPVAWRGGDENYFRAMPLGLEPGKAETYGLGGRAVTERQAIVANDMANDPRVLLRAQAGQRGFSSLAVLPLVVAGDAVGVLTLYAREIGFFDDEEMKLLNELAGDISFALDHIEKEERVKHLTRVYAVLSGINAIIVRVRDREELYREACRVAVDAGKFRFARLDVVDEENRTLKPVATAGPDEGYQDLVRNRLSLRDDAPGGHGIAATAVRQKRAVVVDDTQADPRVRFKKEHKDRGIRSIVALPLMIGGEPVGAFSLHAGETGFFDEEEMRLLSELAGDISFAIDHLQKAEKLDYLAYYDAITGFANRNLFLERLEERIRAAGSASAKLAVSILDIERFKSVNDAFGRQAGDQLLQQVARRLQQVRGDASRLARIGGDQFAVVIAGVENEDDVARCIEHKLQACFAAPFRIGEQELRIAVRVGIAMFPSDGEAADKLLLSAEAALEKAKSTGERYVFFTPQMTGRIAEKLALENKLGQALEKEEFILHYQPKVDLGTRRIVGVEALIRWQSPERGLVPPLQFIPLLEETGLILQVGSWAIKRASLDHRNWVQQGFKGLRVAVNVSAIQLRQRDFVEVIEQAIMEGLAPTGIDLEITESLVMQDIQGNIQKLNSVRALGINIAIDDFGTGYSSLAYLARLPVQSLKIDRSFIDAMNKDPNAMTLVSTIISLAHSLRLKVIAEGVETEEQANFLRLLKCDEMQGYLFSKPLPRDDISALLRTSSG
jgi:diguanylate cyclase (GGDEF)-like protein/PAS domain S-box-containing protein